MRGNLLFKYERVKLNHANINIPLKNFTMNNSFDEIKLEIDK